MALAWLLAQHENLLPVSGTCSAGHLEKNLAADDKQVALVSSRR